MKVLSRLCTSLDGCVAGDDGLPIYLGSPDRNASRLGVYEADPWPTDVVELIYRANL
jgi:hypothetical protein